MLAPILPRPTMPSCIRSPLSDFACLQLPISPNQRIGRAVVLERGLLLIGELRDDALGQHLAELDAPLVERVDVPDRRPG